MLFESLYKTGYGFFFVKFYQSFFLSNLILHPAAGFNKSTNLIEPTYENIAFVVVVDFN